MKSSTLKKVSAILCKESVFTAHEIEDALLTIGSFDLMKLCIQEANKNNLPLKVVVTIVRNALIFYREMSDVNPDGGKL